MVLNLQCKNYCILNNFVKKNSTKSKLKVLRKLGQALDSIGKLLTSGILGDFKIFRPKVKEIFKFEVFFCH
jgi:hypothetical protein